MRTLLSAVTLVAVMSTAALFAAEAPTSVLSGKLKIQEGKPAVIQTADHKTIKLDGDATTRKVLADPRVNGFDVQARGHFTAKNAFLIDPITTHAMLVHKDGCLKLVTYWCDACKIRSYTPGPCACCEKETVLDLKAPEELEKENQ